jgi:hypothetical protein
MPTRTEQTPACLAKCITTSAGDLLTSLSCAPPFPPPLSPDKHTGGVQRQQGRSAGSPHALCDLHAYRRGIETTRSAPHLLRPRLEPPHAPEAELVKLGQQHLRARAHRPLRFECGFSPPSPPTSTPAADALPADVVPLHLEQSSTLSCL